MSLKRSLVLALLLTGILAGFAYADGARYWTNYPYGVRAWNLIFPAPPARELYQDSSTALDIQDVQCDGKKIEPEIEPLVGYPITATIENREGAPIYQCSLGFFECWDDLNDHPKPDSFYKMRHFHLPETAQTVSVRYRIRFPGGTSSDQMKITFVASERNTMVLVPPHQPNQALEPTSTAVTPPASAGDRASGARGSP